MHQNIIWISKLFVLISFGLECIFEAIMNKYIPWSPVWVGYTSKAKDLQEHQTPN